MDAADAMTTPFGAWASIRGYFTPATLFLVVNIVIGTIALTSRSHQRRRREDHHLHDDDGLLHHRQEQHQRQQGEEYGHYYDHQQQQQTEYYATPPPPLAHTSSVLDRLRSIGLYRFRSGDFPPEFGAAASHAPQDSLFSPVADEEDAAKQQYARSRSEPAPAREERRAAPPRMRKSGSEARKAQAVRAPAARVVEAVAEDDAVVYARAEGFVGDGSRRPEPSPALEEEYVPEEYVPPRAPVHTPPAPLARTSSVLDRLRSIGLYGFLAPEQPAAPAAGERKQAQYDRTRSEPAKQKKQAVEARMDKSSSAARKQAAAPIHAEECVDARADAFIDSFRRDRSSQQQALPRYPEEHTAPPPAPLARTSSVLDRLRSFGTYLRSGDVLGPENPVVPAEEEKHYSRSRSEPAREQGKREKKKQQEARMTKSSSEAGMADAAEAAVPEHGVDERADDFINKFRQQLQLQRLNSLLNYKEMLGGGKQ